jgi:hypothetical protein
MPATLAEAGRFLEPGTNLRPAWSTQWRPRVKKICGEVEWK